MVVVAGRGSGAGAGSMAQTGTDGWRIEMEWNRRGGGKIEEKRGLGESEMGAIY